MFIPLLVILLGTAAVSAAPTENEELHAKYSDPVKACVWGHTDKTHSDVSLEECKGKCATESFGCKSVEYRESSKKCWLSKDTKESQPSSYQQPCGGSYSDLVYLEKTGESGGDDVFEGDMILSEAQKKMAEKYVILTDAQQAEADKEEKQEKDGLTEDGDGIQTGRSFNAYSGIWPEKKLYYDLSELGWWSPFLKRKIRNALEDLQEKIGNCVEFIEKDSGPRVEVHTHKRDGCRSTVGYLGITQMDNKLNLGSGCQNKGVIQHEFLHALGFFHSQSRSDRDKYITVMEDNIITNALPNFHKYDPMLVKHFGLPYDYSSVMHYESYDFTNNAGGMTIVTKDPRKQGLIGQREGVSQGDIKMIRKAYNCA